MPKTNGFFPENQFYYKQIQGKEYTKIHRN